MSMLALGIWRRASCETSPRAACPIYGASDWPPWQAQFNSQPGVHDWTGGDAKKRLSRWRVRKDTGIITADHEFVNGLRHRMIKISADQTDE